MLRFIVFAFCAAEPGEQKTVPPAGPKAQAWPVMLKQWLCDLEVLPATDLWSHLSDIL